MSSDAERIESLQTQLAEARINLSREMRARDAALDEEQ